MKTINHILRSGILILSVTLFMLVSSFEALATTQINETSRANIVENEIIQLRSVYEKHYLNDDGTVTAVIHSMPIHYYENGQWLEIDNTLNAVKSNTGSLVYQNANGPMQVTLPQKLQNGNNILSVEHDGYTIEWELITNNQTTRLSSDAEVIDTQRYSKLDCTDNQSRLTFEATDNLTSQIRYEDVFDNTDIEYTVFPECIKEDIILNEWDGVANFQYQLNTELEATILSDNSINFVDETNEAVFAIPPMFMYDSAEIAEYNYNVDVTMTENSDGYLMTITLDTEWLSDTDRVYPVVVDPTITLGSTAINDTTIYSGLPNANYGSSEYLVVGDHGDTYGTGKALIWFPITSLPTIESIESATLNLREASGKTNSSYVLVYAMDSGWGESSATWATAFEGESQLYCSSSSVSNNLWNHFDVTNAVQWWYNHSHTQGNTGVPNWGLVIETAGTFSSKHFCSSEHASYAPSVTITYNNNMYSLEYKPYKYNNAIIQTNFQKRMNCYGYAMQMYYRGDLSIFENGEYKQQPGEFVTNRSDLDQEYDEHFYDTNVAYWDFIVSNLYEDFDKLEYNLTETTVNATIPSGKRKIALVTAPVYKMYDENGVYLGDWRDYHFYARDNEGYWSHKRGSRIVTNKALSDETTVLTDDNIANTSLHGLYNSGIKFFLIDKDVNVYDFAHGNGYASTSGTPVY